MILEPLAVTTIDSVYPNVPMLAKSIPSTADGSVAADGTSVTWKLRDGVKWSDGTPFTADDVKATWQYIMKPENGATDVSHWLVQVGPHPSKLEAVGVAKRQGFETAIPLRATSGYASVTALDRSGRKLASSRAARL